MTGGGRGVYATLTAQALDTGESIEVGVVEPGGDSDWQPRVEALLADKSPLYRQHVALAFRGGLDDLETLFYVGTVRGEPVTVAMLAGAHGAAIFGHVLTLPRWRRRGAARVLHSALPRDWRRRGYRVVTLGTDPQGHARRLYEGIGFETLAAGRGDMIWRDGPDGGAVAEVGASEVGPLRWGDWGWVSESLCTPPEPGESLPRSPLFHVRQQRYVDWPFIAALCGDGSPRNRRAEVAVLRRGVRAVGWAALLPATEPVLGADALELYLRPGARSPAAAHRLLSALPWPERPVLHACTLAEDWRAGALATHGFTIRAVLPAWWDLGRGPEAAQVWIRR